MNRYIRSRKKKWLKALKLNYRISIGGRSTKYRYYTKSRVESMLALQEVRR
jgi:predicted RNase H-related nuclease YkuK (DUF458 family)